MAGADNEFGGPGTPVKDLTPWLYHFHPRRYAGDQ